MEPSLIAAITAAGVSVASMVANLYIAWKSRQTTVEALQVKATIDRLGDANSAIKEVEVESERLRIRCWELIAVSERLQTAPNSLLKGNEKEFVQATEDFMRQANLFLDKWAIAKTEFPLWIAGHLRLVRHECRDQIQLIRLQCSTLVEDKRVAKDSPAGQIRDLLATLLKLLDSFIAIVSTVRKALVEGLLAPDEFLAMRTLPSGSRSVPTITDRSSS